MAPDEPCPRRPRGTPVTAAPAAVGTGAHALLFPLKGRFTGIVLALGLATVASS